MKETSNQKKHLLKKHPKSNKFIRYGRNTYNSNIQCSEFFMKALYITIAF